MAPYGRFARISHAKLTRPGKHDGVQLPDGRVVHINNVKGLHVCSLVEFRRSHDIKVEHVPHPTQFLEAGVRLQALLQENRLYHAIDFNCEIVARIITGEPANSPQVSFWTLVAIVSPIVWLAANGA